MQTVLCVDEKSNYHKISNLDLYTKERNAYNYTGTGRIITHPPCQQWSRLKAFAKEDKLQKELAFFCYELVNKYGGILEHPNGTSFFKTVGANRKNITKVYQSWFGFPCKKETLLYCVDVKLLSSPISFDTITRTVDSLNSAVRSRMPLKFCTWLIDSINAK